MVKTLSSIPSINKNDSAKIRELKETKEFTDRTIAQTEIDKSILDANNLERKENLLRSLIGQHNSTSDATIQLYIQKQLTSLITHDDFPFEKSIPILFELDPPAVKLRKELIEKIKKLLEGIDNASALHLASIIDRQCIVTSHPMRVNNQNERKELRQQQIKLYFQVATESKDQAQIRIAENALYALAKDPELMQDVALMKELNKSLSIIEYKKFCVLAQNEQAHKNRKDDLQKWSQHNLLPAVKSLEKWIKDNDESIVGRRLYLNVKVSLLARKDPRKDFPELSQQQIDDMVTTSRADLDFYATSPKIPSFHKNAPYEYHVIAKWYNYVINTLIPDLQQSNNDQEKKLLLNQLNDDPDVFLLNIAQQSEKYGFTKEEAVVIKKRTEMDMSKAMNNAAWFAEKTSKRAAFTKVNASEQKTDKGTSIFSSLSSTLFSSTRTTSTAKVAAVHQAQTLDVSSQSRTVATTPNHFVNLPVPTAPSFYPPLDSLDVSAGGEQSIDWTKVSDYTHIIQDNSSSAPSGRTTYPSNPDPDYKSNSQPSAARTGKFANTNESKVLSGRLKHLDIRALMNLCDDGVNILSCNDKEFKEPFDRLCKQSQDQNRPQYQQIANWFLNLWEMKGQILASNEESDLKKLLQANNILGFIQNNLLTQYDPLLQEVANYIGTLYASPQPQLSQSQFYN